MEKKDCGYSAEELMPLVSELAALATEKASTSVSYELAEQLMEAVIYCICEGQEQNLPAVEKPSARDAYAFGYQCVLQKVESMRRIYNRMMEDFCDYGNRCLSETVRKGIPAFLKWYDARLHPQNTILTLDYPLPVSVLEYCGIDIIFNYVNFIALEQNFLGFFPETYVREILKNYAAGVTERMENEELYASDMIENIGALVFENALGRMLMHRTEGQCEMTDITCGMLRRQLGIVDRKQGEKLLATAGEKMLRQIFEDGSYSYDDAAAYFAPVRKNFAARIWM